MDLNLINQNQEERISSVELAELCGKQHKNVLSDIKRMEPEYLGVFGQELSFQLSFTIRQLPNGGSKKDPFYSLTKSQSLFVVSSYNTTIRAMVQKRWEDLEREKQLNTPKTFSEALYLAAAQAEQIENQKKEIAKQSEVITEQESTISDLTKNFEVGMTISQFARQLNGVNFNKFQSTLLSMNLIKYISDWRTVVDENRLCTGYSSTTKTKSWFQLKVKPLNTIKKDRNGNPYRMESSTLQVTKTGAEELFKLYQKDTFPMVKSWDGKYTFEK